MNNGIFWKEFSSNLKIKHFSGGLQLLTLGGKVLVLESKEESDWWTLVDP